MILSATEGKILFIFCKLSSAGVLCIWYVFKTDFLFWKVSMNSLKTINLQSHSWESVTCRFILVRSNCISAFSRILSLFTCLFPTEIPFLQEALLRRLEISSSWLSYLNSLYLHHGIHPLPLEHVLEVVE